jgi:NAD(P)-dependent dehydrogenase (short-subunit alcohol dehydrogenase family)
MSDSSGRVALVTGAGVGLAIAAELMERGVRVCVTGAGEEELDFAVQVLGSEVLALPGPLLDPHHHQTVVYKVLDALGRIDVLVNNVPYGMAGGPLVETDLLTLRRALTLDVVVPLGWVQRVYWSWMAAHGGSVLNVAALPAQGPAGPPGGCDVGGEALVHLTRQLARELAPRVRVNTIAPGDIGPDGGAPDEQARPPAGLPAGPAATSVARLAAFLLSDQSASISGETVVVHHDLLRSMAVA